MRNPTFDAAGLQVFERGWLSSNNVLFDGRGSCESVLIDSGYCTHATQTVSLVRQALGSRGLDRIVNTHLHSDHCGGNHALQSAFDCAIDVPSGEVDKVDAWDDARLTYVDTGQQCPRFRRTGSFRDGDEIHCGFSAWQVIAAPGHDPESVVLYQPEFRVLISADALWENGFGVVFPELEGEQAFDQVRMTLDRLGKLEAEWIIPGHGPPFQGLPAAIERAHRRLDSFIADPARHSRHAAKVLIKFHLLEIQEQQLTTLMQWMANTRYLHLTHSLHFESTPFSEWCVSLLSDLSSSGAICVRDHRVINL